MGEGVRTNILGGPPEDGYILNGGSRPPVHVSSGSAHARYNAITLKTLQIMQ